jgi:2-keto-4-pentenoate hydratase
VREALIVGAAQSLWDAEAAAAPIEPLTDDWPDLTTDEAYAIAARNILRWGRAMIGYKLGFTSEAMRRQMGIDEPNFGVLTAGRDVAGPFGVIEAAELIHPRLEAEIGLVIRAPIKGRNHDARTVSEYVEAAVPCLEIVDSRYNDYRFRCEDNIADNSSAARFVCGHPIPLNRAGDLRAVEVELSINGKIMDRGRGTDALGGPLTALAWLANALHAVGQELPGGVVVLTGGLTRAHVVARGHAVAATFAGLGEVRLACV